MASTIAPVMSAADLFGIKDSFNKDKDPIRKKLFRSPVVEGDRMNESESALTLMNRLQIEHDTELSYKALRKGDMHDQRLKQMRQTLKKLSEDDWRYPDVDKLIGLH